MNFEEQYNIKCSDPSSCPDATSQLPPSGSSCQPGLTLELCRQHKTFPGVSSSEHGSLWTRNKHEGFGLHLRPTGESCRHPMACKVDDQSRSAPRLMTRNPQGRAQSTRETLSDSNSLDFPRPHDENGQFRTHFEHDKLHSYH